MEYRIKDTLTGDTDTMTGSEVLTAVVNTATDREHGAIEELQAKLIKLTELIGLLIADNPEAISTVLAENYRYRLLPPLKDAPK